jgi:hypothetical protein
MADSYGIEVYNSGGVKTFSLVDNIFRVFKWWDVTSSMVPYDTGYTWVSYTTTSVSSDDFFFIFMPKSINKTAYTQESVNTSASNNPIGTKIRCTIKKGTTATINGDVLFDFSDCMAILIGKA